MALGQNCTADDDLSCPGVFMCTTASWTNDESICTCQGHFGWTGPKCLDLSTQSFVSIGLAVLWIVVALGLFVWGGVVLAKFVSQFGLKFDAQSATMAMGMASNLLLAVWKVVIILEVINPEKNTLAVQSGDNNKAHEFTPYERVALGLGVTFAILAALNTALVWIRVARKSQKLSKMDRNKVLAFRKVVLVVQVFFLVGVSILFGSGNIVGVGFFGIPFFIVIAGLYFFGSTKMLHLLAGAHSTPSSPESDTDGKKPKLSRLAMAIKKASIRVYVGIFFVILSGVIYLSVVTVRGQEEDTDTSKPVHISTLALELLPLGLFVMSWAINEYLQEILGRKILAQKSSKMLTSSSSFAADSSFQQTSFASME